MNLETLKKQKLLKKTLDFSKFKPLKQLDFKEITSQSDKLENTAFFCTYKYNFNNSKQKVTLCLKKKSIEFTSFQIEKNELTVFNGVSTLKYNNNFMY